MKYLIVKSFKGSPDGRFAVEYNAGETVELSDSLARVALGEEWVKVVPGSSGSADAGGKGAAPVQAAVRKKGVK